MGADIAALGTAAATALADWIGERPATVLAIHALRSGRGRVWVSGAVTAPRAVLVESSLVPGEPQGFGDPAEIVQLFASADGCSCAEVKAGDADVVTELLMRRHGPVRRAVDVIHSLGNPPPVFAHPLVRRLALADATELSVAADLFPSDGQLVVDAAARGFVFVAESDGRIVGHGSSLAAGTTCADISVHVHDGYRGQGIATAAAAAACAAVRAAGLTPVWGAGSDNAASRRVAAKLNFVEVERLVYVIVGSPDSAP